jgi:glycosyltransferase involved in cell wall biosynthesis
MRVTAHLGVIDEVELIGPAIDHLYKIGVDHVICFDMGSKDGTLDVIERYRGPEFELVRLANSTPWDELRQRTVESIKRSSADWALLLDADEFWLPATGSIKDCVALAEQDIVTVPRFNVALTDTGLAMPDDPGPEDYDQILLYARPFPHFRAHLLVHPETPWIRGVPGPKVMARTALIDSVTMGRHDVVSADGQRTRRSKAADVVIAHVPFSSRDRFERRVANISEFFVQNENYLNEAQGWHWRRLYRLARQGRTGEEYEHQIVDRLRLDALVKSGAVSTVSQLLSLKDPSRSRLPK